MVWFSLVVSCYLEIGDSLWIKRFRACSVDQCSNRYSKAYPSSFEVRYRAGLSF